MVRGAATSVGCRLAAVTVINLNRFRKRKEREAQRKQADVNALRHGRTKEQKELEAEQQRKLEEVLDGAKLERDEDDEPPPAPE